jgi:hypothetical protein
VCGVLAEGTVQKQTKKVPAAFAASAFAAAAAAAAAAALPVCCGSFVWFW